MPQMTNRQLIAELRRVSNLHGFDNMEREGDHIREATDLYRSSWLDPLLDEVERRLCKTKGKNQ